MKKRIKELKYNDDIKVSDSFKRDIDSKEETSMDIWCIRNRIISSQMDANIYVYFEKKEDLALYLSSKDFSSTSKLWRNVAIESLKGFPGTKNFYADEDDNIYCRNPMSPYDKEVQDYILSIFNDVDVVRIHNYEGNRIINKTELSMKYGIMGFVLYCDKNPDIITLRK